MHRLITPGHGYLVLSAERQQRMPDALRLSGARYEALALSEYEEDVGWARVALAFPECFDQKTVGRAHRVLKEYHPDTYTAFTGQPVDPAESRVLRERLFRQANIDNYVAMTAWGDWHEDVPTGKVGVFAGRGGRLESGAYPEDTAYFLVPKEEYAGRGEFGYVVDPGTCEPWQKPE